MDWYCTFDGSKFISKNTCLFLYVTFKSILTCIRNFWPQTRIHQDVCIKTNIFGVFLIVVQINWMLAFHMPWECSDLTLHYLFGVLYIEPVGYIEGGESWEQGNNSSLFPHLFMLEFASLCPFGAHSAAPTKLAFVLWDCHWEMEDWIGRCIGGGLDFSSSQKCRQSLSLLYLSFINRNINFLSNRCAHIWILYPWMYLFTYTWLIIYSRVGLTQYCISLLALFAIF